jgi:hypothetical protein
LRDFFVASNILAIFGQHSFLLSLILSGFSLIFAFLIKKTTGAVSQLMMIARS